MIYHRVTAVIENDALKSPAPAIAPLGRFLKRGEMPSSCSYGRSNDRGFNAMAIDYGLVLFAGRLYPVARVAKTEATKECQRVVTYVYEFETLEKIMSDYGASFCESRSLLRMISKDSDVRGPQEFFALKGDDRLHEHATNERIVCALIGNFHGPQVVINPQLSDVEFFRCLEPYQAYQEISMFLGNLAAPERKTVVIEDKYRIEQHGFDLKQSFRKRPASV